MFDQNHFRFYSSGVGLYNFWLVVSTPLKNSSQLGLLFPIYGKIQMFQTTNQIYICSLVKDCNVDDGGQRRMGNMGYRQEWLGLTDHMGKSREHWEFHHFWGFIIIAHSLMEVNLHAHGSGAEQDHVFGWCFLDFSSNKNEDVFTRMPVKVSIQSRKSWWLWPTGTEQNWKHIMMAQETTRYFVGQLAVFLADNWKCGTGPIPFPVKICWFP